ncbi:MAG: His-Xaa-Ser repeat protein HxsA4 [Actinobacteria bacterium]|nr:His-Xaa-Ser repeat protein HxsA4 [Actinomycetota bacterium]MCG2700795.1 His-Xaa-Ser repeat protein HxsA4 [Candidatus Parcubacteria bacterium]
MPKKLKILPQIKKEVKSFLTREEGSITKKDAIKMSKIALVAGIGLAGAIKPDPTMAQTCNCCDPCPTHCSHSSHSSHGSHGSHSSHGSHGSRW